MRHFFFTLATATFGAAALFASGPALFPVPVHLTRRFVDPVSRSTMVVDQYCYADRVVTVAGDRTSISDYAKRELTTIDRTRGVYSITSFDEAAKATATFRKSGAGDQWITRAAVPRYQPLLRDGYALELTDTERPDRRIEVTFDRSVLLSKDAYDVLAGAAYPNTPSEAHENIANAARSSRPQSDGPPATYALPISRIDTFVIDGEAIETRDEITRIGNELPPANSLEIPPGARRIELPSLALEKLSRSLDSLPASRR